MKKVKINCSFVSNRGRRKTNEDSVLVELNKNYGMNQAIVAVSDGMGGFHRGDVASKIMIEQLKNLVQKRIPGDFLDAANFVKNYIKGANDIIYRMAQNNSEKLMGCTVSGALIVGNQCLFFNVGDSRTYVVTLNGVHMKTEDHTADEDAIKRGIMKEGERGKGNYSHALTRSVGTDPEVEVDIFPRDEFYVLHEGELILVCTDGLWNVVTNKEILVEMVGRRNIRDSLNALLSLAYFKKSMDNISVAAFEYGIFPRKNLDLKKYPPIHRPKDEIPQKRRRLLPVLLGTSILSLFAVVLITLFNVIKPSQPSSLPPTSTGSKDIKKAVSKPPGEAPSGQPREDTKKDSDKTKKDEISQSKKREESRGNDSSETDNTETSRPEPEKPTTTEPKIVEKVDDLLLETKNGIYQKIDPIELVQDPGKPRIFGNDVEFVLIIDENGNAKVENNQIKIKEFCLRVKEIPTPTSPFYYFFSEFYFFYTYKHFEEKKFKEKLISKIEKLKFPKPKDKNGSILKNARLKVSYKKISNIGHTIRLTDRREE